jgi:hypothetical protein
MLALLRAACLRRPADARGYGSSLPSPTRHSAALSTALGFRTNWMQVMIIQIQKAMYGKTRTLASKRTARSRGRSR